MVHRKLINGATYKIQAEIADAIDKGPNKGVFVTSRLNGYLIDKNGNKDLAYYVDKTHFGRTLGGSGIKSSDKITPLPSTPKRQYDLVLRDKIYHNQALIYRLVSDRNPLHADPKIAALVKYPKPIVHGN